MDPVKEAFAKAKQDIFNLQSQIESLKKEISSLKDLIKASSLNVLNQQSNQQSNTPTDTSKYSSISSQIPTIQHIPTDKLPQYGSKEPFRDISIRNEGVPTDRQTNQQTVRHTGNEGVQSAVFQQISSTNSQKTDKIDKISHLEHVSSILNSLDVIKKELRIQFKHLTSQEMAIFSCIYNLEEQGFVVDYSLVSQKMSLSESSIRDYTQKIIKKGIPIIKTKENNKKILLSIDKNLKKIASLQTILTLRLI
jgi:chromosome segregation ATPase